MNQRTAINLAGRLLQVYFNVAYNQVYDFTTARLSLYRKLQERCIGKLQLRDNDRVLCVGIGTGNEIIRILEMNKSVNIVGIDFSNTALQKACKKARRLDKELETAVMDARSLEFETESFDEVLCLHVMDFIEDDEKVTNEILRVLKPGGQFVITYPSVKEGMRLGVNILKDSYHQNISSRNYIIGLIAFLTQMFLGITYLPLLLRKRTFYSCRELPAIFTQLISGDFQIEEYPAYQDLIVYGTK